MLEFNVKYVTPYGAFFALMLLLHAKIKALGHYLNTLGISSLGDATY